MTIFRGLLLAALLNISMMVSGQQAKSELTNEIYLYPKLEEKVKEAHIRDQGGNLIVGKVTNPSLTAFLPEDKNKQKTAVIICPGGGYSNLHIQREGFKVAEAFNKQGIAAFVLKYTLPEDGIVNNKSFAPLKDAQRAIQLTRENAKKWDIDPNKVGIMGFSAGGHLAASAGVHYDSPQVENKKNTNLRPDFMILVYPVISFRDCFGHLGSKDRLLGENADKKLVEFFSNELHVNENTPKTILFHAGDDTIVPVENSLSFYRELQKNKISSELHSFSKGEHGFLTIPSFDEWFDHSIRWLRIEALINH